MEQPHAKFDESTVTYDIEGVDEMKESAERTSGNNKAVVEGVASKIEAAAEPTTFVAESGKEHPVENAFDFMRAMNQTYMTQAQEYRDELRSQTS